MDSEYMNPSSHSSAFMDMLNSQQQIPFPGSLSPTMPLGSPHVPLFSSQCSSDSSPPTEQRPKKRRESRPKWKVAEDLALISAWLNTSKDPVVGNEQKAAAFWNRIAALYARSPTVSGLPKRGTIQCKQRWGRINDIVCKFAGSFEAARRQKTSGYNEDKIVKEAYEIFFNDYEFNFNLEHAWRELHNDPKWCAFTSANGDGSSKRRKCDDGSTHSSSSHTFNLVEDEALPRPPGVKASKAKGKKTSTKTSPVESEGSSLAKFQSMWEIKENDLTLTKDLKKMGILDTLLARGDELSEVEQALKNKLITEML